MFMFDRYQLLSHKWCNAKKSGVIVSRCGKKLSIIISLHCDAILPIDFWSIISELQFKTENKRKFINFASKN